MDNKINLTPSQRHSLDDLWFIWGNGGSKHTMSNHKFIQRILEHGIDNRDFYKPDTELIAIVDEFLGG